GWHRDNWLGRRRQINTFFAEHRLLRWLSEPRVEAALEPAARMPIIQLRQHLAVLAQFDDDWGAAETIRATLAPFRATA
ncbi:fructosamine kinase family protein, partial [Actinoplanes sp. TBRC 11911]|nr:fructosamine kinase family protein [Actinoplanes sp. TBRC 11911]